jgi:TRAP-type C4-dicarboxylate transport system permease small subunit
MMGWLDRLKREIQKFNRFVCGIGAVFLIPLMLITSSDVIARDIFNHPIPGTIELSEYMLSVFVLLGLGYTQQVKAHVEVSLFISRIPARFRSIFRLITLLLSLFIFSILTWQGWKVGIEERTVSDMLRIPQYPFRLLVALAAFLVCLELLIDLVGALKQLFQEAS